jgi:hypothetical protein
VESGFAQRTDVARAFGRSVRTIRRYQEGYADGGMVALGREEGWRRGLKSHDHVRRPDNSPRRLLPRQIDRCDTPP